MYAPPVSLTCRCRLCAPQGSPEDFVDWIRSGGAISKRTVPLKSEPSAAPPPQLLHDMLQVHEGMRQLAYHFQQAKAMHAVQLRTILHKLTMRGLLAPESAAYISSLPPATQNGQQVGGLASGFAGLPTALPTGLATGLSGGGPNALGGLASSGLPDLGSSIASALPVAFPTGLGGAGGGLGGVPIGRASHDSLQAQLDALEAGLLAPLSSGGDSAGNGSGGSDSGGSGAASARPTNWSIDSTYGACIGSGGFPGEETLSLITESGPYHDKRMPQPYPVGAGKPLQPTAVGAEG